MYIVQYSDPNPARKFWPRTIWAPNLVFLKILHNVFKKAGSAKPGTNSRLGPITQNRNKRITFLSSAQCCGAGAGAGQSRYFLVGD